MIVDIVGIEVGVGVEDGVGVEVGVGADVGVGVEVGRWRSWSYSWSKIK